MTPSRPRRTGRVAAAQLPVARLLVDVPLPHLDRPFDYLVPEELSATVGPGSRVRVRFAGRLVDGYVLDRLDASEHPGRLSFVERAVGDEPVLTAETARLFQAVADRYAGSFVDVVRLGVPARHAGAESAPGPQPPPESAIAPESAVPPPSEVPMAGGTGGWARYRAGPAFVAAIAERRPARAVWSALPGEDWPRRIAEAMSAALATGRGAVAVVPDLRDLARLDTALGDVLGGGRHVALSAELGPAERYRRWLAVRRGTVRAVAGTRVAALAPVADVGLLAIWDDGDDLYAEPRAPYPHARDVLVLRSSLTGAALLVGGFARTAEAALLAESGWAHEIVADRAVVRAASPRIVAAGDDIEAQRDPAARAARLPSLAFRVAREALAAGTPVLVQVPRRGYVPTLACAQDRMPARCPACGGPLAARSGHAMATCGWCGRPAGAWACPACGGRRLRAVVVGSTRPAEELGRAFPGVPVRTSSGDTVLDSVPAQPSLVIATPGAEPLIVATRRADGRAGPSNPRSRHGRDSSGARESGDARGSSMAGTAARLGDAAGSHAHAGYGAALLLDGWALLGRPDLRAGEEALRRWCNAAALVRADGQVVVVADAGVPAVQALIRWDAAGAAARELADRQQLAFPPAVRMAALTGTAPAITEILESLGIRGRHGTLAGLDNREDGGGLAEEYELIGPVPLEDNAQRGDAQWGNAHGTNASGGAAQRGNEATQRALIRVPREHGAQLAAALKSAAAARAARKAPDPVKITLDPLELF